MNAEVEKLSKDTSSILFLNIEAEEQPDIVESFNVTSVPTVLLLQVSLVLPTELCLAPPVPSHIHLRTPVFSLTRSYHLRAVLKFLFFPIRA